MKKEKLGDEQINAMMQERERKEGIVTPPFSFNSNPNANMSNS